MVRGPDKFKERARNEGAAMTMHFGDWGAMAFVLAGAFTGGFVNGLTGFGTALTGLPFWLQAVDPIVAAQLASAGAVVGHITTLPAIWRAMDGRRLAPMLIAGLIGVPIGTWLLPSVGLHAFKLTVGIVLVVYCSVMLFAAGRIRVEVGGPKIEATVGLFGGILGGMAGLSGALPTVWATLKGWSKTERRAIFQAFNMTILTAMLVASLVQGLIGQRFLVALTVALPGTLVGSWLGARIYCRLDDHRYDRIVLVLLLISGLALVLSGG
jgi:uncharacterized membrane protein YfcA